MQRLMIAAVMLNVLAGPVSAQPCLREVARWGYGPARVVDVAGDIAVFTSGIVLMVGDVSDPALPVVMGEMSLEGALNDIALADSLAVALPDEGGVMVIDLVDPSRPRQLASIAKGWIGKRVQVTGGYAWVAAGCNGLRVVDLADPGHPVEVGGRPVQECGPYVRGAEDVAVTGSVAYLADGDLRVLDVSDPSQPVVLGSHEVTGRVVAVEAAGGRVYVSDARDVGWWYASVWETALIVMDAAHPRYPVPVGEMVVDFLCGAVGVSGDRVYLASVYARGDYSGLLWINAVDISDPRSPRLAGAYDPGPASRDVVFHQDRALAATDRAGLRVIDVTVPPGEELGAVEMPGYTASVAALGEDHVVVADWCGTIVRVLDLSAAERVTEVAAWTVEGCVRAMAVHERRTVLLLIEDQLHVVDLSEPDDPRELTRIDLLQDSINGDIAMAGQHAYVASGYGSGGGLRIIDLHQPQHAREVGFVNLDYPRAVAVGEPTAYVVANTSPDGSGIHLVNIADPEHPAVVSQLELSRKALADVALAGSHVLACGFVGDDGLHIVDVSDPASPVLVQFVAIRGARRVVTAGRLAFVKSATSGWSDISVLDLTDPLQPVRVARVSDPSGVSWHASASTLAVSGTSLFAAQWFAGLRVLDAAACFGPHPRRPSRRLGGPVAP